MMKPTPTAAMKLGSEFYFTRGRPKELTRSSDIAF